MCREPDKYDHFFVHNTEDSNKKRENLLIEWHGQWFF